MVLGWGKKTVTKQEDEEDMTMDEILASIRKYVTEDQSPRDLYGVPAQPIRTNEAYSQEAVTKKNQEQLTDYDAPYIAPKESREGVAGYYPKHLQVDPMLSKGDLASRNEKEGIEREFLDRELGVSSDQTISAAASALSRLAELKTSEKAESTGSSVTLDALITNIARPMIKEWMDQHLSQIVEKMVAKEIDRIRTYGK